MITGMIKPSSGNAYILGNSVIDDRKTTTKYVGFCPQYSILYDCLTVNEHLKFYGRLKGGNNSVSSFKLSITYTPISELEKRQLTHLIILNRNKWCRMKFVTC